MNNTLNVSYINIDKDKARAFRESLESQFKKIKGDNFEVYSKNISVHSLLIIKYKDLMMLQGDINNPIVLVLEGQYNSEDLINVFKFNIVDIVNENISSERLVVLANKVTTALMYNQLAPSIVDYIAKASIKVKNLDLLNDYLEGYFSLFEKTKFVSFFIKDKDSFEYISGKKDESIESFIKELSLEDKYIGSSFHFDEKVLIPVNNDNGNVVWVIVQTELEDMEFLNDLLFIHLNRINLYKSLKSSVGELTHITMTDEVTGLYNQRKLNLDLDIEVQICNESDQNFSLLFIDIDHFKKVNDNYGHVIGSKFLKDLGEVLVKQVRDTDSVYRYGGDEFIVLMRNTKTQTVHHVAKRMLESVKKHTFNINEKEDYKMSVSIGIAEFPKDANSSKEIIEFADQMMYKSKDSGRGKVFHVKEVSS